jgi:hypothetical protein
MGNRAGEQKRDATMRSIGGFDRFYAGVASWFEDSAQVEFSQVDGVYCAEDEPERLTKSSQKKRDFRDLRRDQGSGTYSAHARRKHGMMGRQGRRLDIHA